MNYYHNSYRIILHLFSLNDSVIKRTDFVKAPHPLSLLPPPPHLVAPQVVAVVVQKAGDLLHVDGVVEGRRVSDLPLVGAHLALEALDEMADRHPARHGVRVDDDVGVYALARKRHVL